MCYIHDPISWLNFCFILGILHTISKPLLPPPSIFQEIFLFQSPFSTFVSLYTTPRILYESY